MMYYLRSKTQRTDANDHINPIVTYILAKYIAASKCIAPILFPTKIPVEIDRPTGTIKKRSEMFLRMD